MWKLNKAQSLIEMIVAVSLITSVMIAAYSLIVVTTKMAVLSRQKMQAQGYLQEGLEKVRNKRDNNLRQNTPSYSDDIVSKLGEQLDDKMTRDTIIDNSIPNTLKVTVKISWNNNANEVSASELLTDWTK